jgi:FkbM family methyltransferase
MDQPQNGEVLPLTALIRQRFALNEPVFFVQIGANDGIMNDPIYDLVIASQWRGLLIEPIKATYDALCENYRHKSDLLLANCAIADEPGSRIIYSFKYNDDIFQQLFSLVPEKLESSRNEVARLCQCMPEDLQIVGGQVWCETLENLLKRYGVEKIDFIIMDVEGYEWNIIKSYNFDYLKPKIVIYEKTHLSEEDQTASMAYLAKFGYRLEAVDDNIVAELVPVQ